MGNNPIANIDPDGEFIFTTLALLIPGAQPLIPFAIGADIGMWSGGSMANGTANPLKWDWSSGRTWGYMAAGATVGAASGGVADAVAASGMPFANTMSLLASSLTNSVGTYIYTGSQTDLTLSVGVASFNLNTQELGFLGKKGNTFGEDVGYAFGALSNIQDAFAGFEGTKIDVHAKKETAGHNWITNKTKSIDISVGPESSFPWKQVEGSGFFNRMRDDINWAIAQAPRQAGKYYATTSADISHAWSIRLNNVNSKVLKDITKNIKKGIGFGGGSLKYGFGYGCVSYVGKSLARAGVLTLPINLFPVLLNTQLAIRQLGIYASPFLINNRF
jgi:hypothetical protein